MYQQVVTGSMANVFQVNICLMPAGGTRGHALHRPQRTQLQHPSPQQQYRRYSFHTNHTIRERERERERERASSASQTHQLLKA